VGEPARVLTVGPYTRAEAAQLLRVSVSTIDRERLAGRLVALRVRGRVLYTWDAIEQYKRARLDEAVSTGRTSTSEAASTGATSAEGSASRSAPRTARRPKSNSASASPLDVRSLLGLRRKS